MPNYKRTHTCGELRKEHVNTKTKLSGWVNRRRDHGGLIFIDIRDRFGITQLVFDPKINSHTHEAANALRTEWVISVEGKVIPRAEGMTNPKMRTGEIEVEVETLTILSKAKTTPFSICDDITEVSEDLRLRYRYLDIRRGELLANLRMRHEAMLITRKYLDSHLFTEISTPILGKSTPEGARDYLVPSRIHHGAFYALPQSPQLFKQLLMIGGMDRYFQIAPCFRDEDLRADRQPEFTQIDIEMSFDSPDTLMGIIEGLLVELFQKCAKKSIAPPFRKMAYAECIEKYGTDRPDLRFGMEFVRIEDIASRSEFTVLKNQIDAGGIVKAITVPDGAELSRRDIDRYTEFVAQFGLQGLGWMKFQDGTLTSSIVKFFSEELQQELIARMGISNGDLLLIAGGKESIVNQSLDHLRRHIARERKLYDETALEFVWVTDFPLFEWDEDERRFYSTHHPFTAPLPEDLALLDTDPAKVRSNAYDIVLNGYELGGGSQRIHNTELQTKIFTLLNLTQADIETKFGFFGEALQYGTPPHLGIALGLDRLMMLLIGTENIRDVIAFPKTQKASDVMMQCPSQVEETQLDELRIHITPEKISRALANE